MNLLINSSFFMKGMSKYTKSGYQKAMVNFKMEDLTSVDLSTKRIIVTGSNSGIGYECALSFAQKGAEVHMLCRNHKRADEAREKIVESTQNQRIFVHIVDMSCPRQIIKFASDFASKYVTLNILVNNAGCMVADKTFTEDNIEVNFATNTLGTYILTDKLIPTLSKSLDPRVVIVSSGGMLTQKLNALDPELKIDNSSVFNGTTVYAQNKRQQVVIAEMLAQRYPEILFVAMHPGWANTPSVQTSMPNFHYWLKNWLRSPAEGADTAIWLATCTNRDALKNGQFYFDRCLASRNLPYSLTSSTMQEKNEFMQCIAKLAAQFS